jgi:hypothetical protein
MIQFLLGALAGGLAAWWWRRDIQGYVDEKLPDLRAKAADGLSAIEQKAQDALDRARHQIDRVRPVGHHGTRTGDMPSSSRPTSGYTPGTGV